ncbi:hypothetical protein [Embleya scabrispora]|uniref:hypothetical protein n=1 Tax=Embleya scabrispora TaxID=159449 RepID=UPI0004777BD3|nr:hypothetical protein [Embleya scabrispora]MYS82398.1 hypothetical protein [Streptomyces sp. SID5474]
MRTIKVGLVAVILACAVGACGSDGDGGFGGLGAPKTTGASGDATPTGKTPTSRATDDDTPAPPTSTRPTPSRPRTTAPATPTSTGAGGGGNDWSSLYSTNFLNGCLSTSNNNTRYCQCALTELQGKYSQAQMNAFDQEYARTNKLPSELQTTVQKCLNR